MNRFEEHAKPFLAAMIPFVVIGLGMALLIRYSGPTTPVAHPVSNPHANVLKLLESDVEQATTVDGKYDVFILKRKGEK